MQREVRAGRAVPPVAAAVLASSALWAPAAMSASSVPAPNHPRIFFWYRTLRKPWFKPPDWASMIGTGVALARQSKRVDPVSARATIPFVAWVSFATVLTATIWSLNRRR